MYMNILNYGGFVMARYFDNWIYIYNLEGIHMISYPDLKRVTMQDISNIKLESSSVMVLQELTSDPSVFHTMGDLVSLLMKLKAGQGIMLQVSEDFTEASVTRVFSINKPNILPLPRMQTLTIDKILGYWRVQKPTITSNIDVLVVETTALFTGQYIFDKKTDIEWLRVFNESEEIFKVMRTNDGAYIDISFNKADSMRSFIETFKDESKDIITLQQEWVYGMYDRLKGPTKFCEPVFGETSALYTIAKYMHDKGCMSVQDVIVTLNKLWKEHSTDSLDVIADILKSDTKDDEEKTPLMADAMKFIDIMAGK